MIKVFATVLTLKHGDELHVVAQLWLPHMGTSTCVTGTSMGSRYLCGMFVSM